MPLRISLLALLLGSSVVSAAELKTLKGEVVKGEVVSVNASDIVLDVAGEKKTFPVKQLVGIDFAVAPKGPLATTFHDVELTDGTLLHCSEVQFKGTDFTVKLLGNEAAVKLPMSTVANILWDAQDATRHKAWAERIARKRNFDAFGVIDGDIINMLEATILSADDKGETVAFKKGTLEGKRKMGTFVGLYFQRTLNPNAPPVVCKLTDLGQSNIMVADIESKDDGLHVKTSSGALLLYKPAQLVRLDYSSSNLAYLSDLTPSNVIETSTEERVEHYRKDSNLDGRPIRLLGQVYTKGLALHATTELEYRLKGEYRTLQLVAGIDDQVGGHNRPVMLRIYADDSLIKEQAFTRKDAKERVQPITLNVKDVKRLRIVVKGTDSDFLDLGLHLDLADIRVIK